MYYSYPSHDSKTQVQYVRNKIGNNYFIVYYKNAARFCFTPKEVGRVFGIAKFTPTVNDIRDWCKEMVEKYETTDSKPDLEPVSIGIVDKETEQSIAMLRSTGFGPECHEAEGFASDDEVETVETNKMVI